MQAHDGRRRILAGVDRAAQALGLFPGMPLAQAQAMLPGLEIAEADPDGDAQALAQVAAWCVRYTPLTAPDPPDGVWLDVTGGTHLHGGEAGLLADLLGRLTRGGFAARAALAETPGAAHALARYGDPESMIVPPGGCRAALATLPVAALRLAPEVAETLRRVGLDRIGQLAAAPRAPLSRRFGPDLLRRLDQAFGERFEPITPVVPPTMITARRAFAEPLLTAEALTAMIGGLVATVCAALEKSARGARRLDLLFERVDGSVQAVRIGTARPTHAPAHLARLLREQLERVDPGLGVEAMRLVVPLDEPLSPRQGPAVLAGEAAEAADIAGLVDRLANRLGAGRVYRVIPVESDVPERSVRPVPPLAPVPGPRRSASWPLLPRPARLLSPPQPIEALSLLPDQPPAAFVWRRLRHRIRRADGPERIFGEWWKCDGERQAVRDYWRVEDEQGRRFWLYRSGDGSDAATGNLRWFLHGLF